jgi:hypothetical protein
MISSLVDRLEEIDTHVQTMDEKQSLHLVVEMEYFQEIFFASLTSQHM